MPNNEFDKLLKLIELYEKECEGCKKAKAYLAGSVIVSTPVIWLSYGQACCPFGIMDVDVYVPHRRN